MLDKIADKINVSSKIVNFHDNEILNQDSWEHYKRFYIKMEDCTIYWTIVEKIQREAKLSSFYFGRCWCSLSVALSITPLDWSC